MCDAGNGGARRARPVGRVRRRWARHVRRDPKPARHGRHQSVVGRPPLGNHPSPAAPRPPRLVGRAPVVRQRAGVARVLRGRAAPPSGERVGQPRRADERDAGGHRRRGEASIRPLDRRRHRVPVRRRRDAPADRHRLDAQPSAHGGRLVPGEGPPPAVAVGSAALHAPPRRR